MADSTGGAKRPAKKAAAQRAPAKRTTAPAKAAAAKPTVGDPPRTTAPATPATTPAAGPVADGRSARSVAMPAIAVVLVLAAVVLLLRLADQEQGGPAHGFVSLEGGIPATLYLPEDAEDDGDLPTPKPEGERPPLVVLAHGYSADQASMSGLARSLARAGYATLTFDFRGHGYNTNRFQGELRDDFAAVVDWAEGSPYVDGDRIAVSGHSMGAGAVTDFASVDARPKAVIPISGGRFVNDAVVPATTLLLVASGDPDRIHENQDELVAAIQAKGGDVEKTEIDGTDHITVLRSSDTVQAMVEFLDPVFGIERTGDTPGMDDPRLKTAAMYLVVLLGLLVLLGLGTGRLAPAGPDDGTAPVYSGFVLVAGALLLTMPLMAGAPIDPLPLGSGQPLIIHFALAAGLLWGTRALAARGQVGDGLATWIGRDGWWPSRASLLTGLAASAVIFVLLAPLAPVLHRLVPNPQRAIFWLVLSAMVLPFFAAFEALTRRGTTQLSIVWGVLAKVLLFAMLSLGLALETVPLVLGLVLPLLALQYLMLEVFASSAYAKSRNTAAIAVVDAVIIGWLSVVLTPVG